jgi:predicted Zn-dependent protease
MNRAERRAAKAKTLQERPLPDDQRTAAMYQSAMQFVAQGRLNGAEVICRQLLAASPNHATALFLLAGVRARQGDMRGAERSLRRSVDADPSATTTWFMLGQIRQQLHQLHRSVRRARGVSWKFGGRARALCAALWTLPLPIRYLRWV